MTSPSSLRQRWQAALELDNFDPLPAHQQMSIFSNRPWTRPAELGGEPRIGAVLCLIYGWIEDQPHLVLTQRPETMRHHSSQISLPGGRVEAGEGWQEAALRETEEEIGVKIDPLAVIGRLSSIYIPPSDFIVHPFVALVEDRPNFLPNPREVAQLIELPISHLLNPINRKMAQRRLEGYTAPVSVPYFDLLGHVVWGATAVILNELKERYHLIDIASPTTSTPF